MKSKVSTSGGVARTGHASETYGIVRHRNRRAKESIGIVGRRLAEEQYGQVMQRKCVVQFSDGNVRFGNGKAAKRTEGPWSGKVMEGNV